MQGRKDYTEKLFMSFQLSDRVPKENFYRRLRETLDLSFLYKDTKELYGKTGNPSIDPVVFFKLLLTGYLENIISDRKLVEHCSMRMDVLYFLGFDIDEELPWHSTLSRTRQLYPIALFETLFNKVFTLCVTAGMVTGHTRAVDSAPVKANASMESLQLKMPATTVKGHLQKVEEENQEPKKKNDPPISTVYITALEHQLRKLAKHQQKLLDCPVSAPGASHEKSQLLSNKTHYSPHDPDARISVKPGKARKLNYRCNIAVDTAEGVISHVQADFADGRDSQYLPHISNQLQNRLKENELLMTDLLADAGYSNGSNYSFLEQKGVTGWVPVFGMYKPVVPGFTHNKESDEYTCSAGKPLPFKGFDHTADGRLLKNYWAAAKDCNGCSLKPSCAPNSSCRKITKTALMMSII
jgi:transposase